MSWIKVEDEKPEEGIIVLAYQPNDEAQEYEMMIVCYTLGKFVSVEDMGLNMVNGHFPYITHWMPLPEKP